MVAEDIATALAYLHTAFSRPFLYCNMNLRNILLDEHGVAKLIDFCNCVSIPHGETFVKVPILRTSDYMMDHYVVVSEKTDAFEFGILMQKLLTGQEKFSEFYGWNEWEILKKRKLPNWLSKSIGEGRIDEIVDPKMLENMSQVSEEDRCQIETFFVLSERCIGLRGEVPEMMLVAKELKEILKTAAFSLSSETQIGS